MSLKYKIFLLLFTPLIILFLIISTIFKNNSQEFVKELSLKHLESVKEIVYDRVKQYVDESEDKIVLFNSRVLLKEAIANYEQTHDKNSTKVIDDILQKAKNIFSDLDNITILDNSGKKLVSMNEIDSLDDYTKDFNYIKTYKKNSINIVFDKETNTPFLSLYSPLINNNKFIGVSIFKVKLDSLNDILKYRKGLGETGEALLGMYNDNNEIIYFTSLRFEKQTLTVKKDDFTRAVPMRRALDGGRSTIEDSFDYRGERVFSTTHFYKRLKLGIVVKKDIKELLEPIDEIGDMMLLLTLIAVIIIIAISWGIAHYLTKEIISIIDATADISKGNLERRVVCPSNDELGVLAKSVNSMADILVNINKNLDATVKEKTHMLEVVNSELELIFDITPNMEVITDGLTMKKANLKFYEFTGYANLENFLESYNCVCDLFVEKRGYLKHKIEDKIWVEYIIDNPQILHKAIIKKDGIDNLFTVHAAKYNRESDSEKYIVVFENTTDLHKIACTDQLTSLANRLKIDEVLVECAEKYKRYGRVFSITLLDIDHFKSVNDTYGHLVGDMILKTISKIITKSIRNVDLVGRWGGEEFIIISKETDIDGAKVLAELLRTTIEEYEFDIVKHQTVSFGVTQFNRGDTVIDLMKHADEALYKAKREGRNRVVVYREGV